MCPRGLLQGFPAVGTGGDTGRARWDVFPKLAAWPARTTGNTAHRSGTQGSRLIPISHRRGATGRRPSNRGPADRGAGAQRRRPPAPRLPRGRSYPGAPACRPGVGELGLAERRPARPVPDAQSPVREKKDAESSITENRTLDQQGAQRRPGSTVPERGPAGQRPLPRVPPNSPAPGVRLGTGVCSSGAEPTRSSQPFCRRQTNAAAAPPPPPPSVPPPQAHAHGSPRARPSSPEAPPTPS